MHPFQDGGSIKFVSQNRMILTFFVSFRMCVLLVLEQVGAGARSTKEPRDEIEAESATSKFANLHMHDYITGIKFAGVLKFESEGAAGL